MKKIIIIIPYYGILPDFFNVWLAGVKKNDSIMFLIISDLCDDIKLPDNVILYSWSFEYFCKYIQSKFSFRIRIMDYYKLTDFKPTWGFIFEEKIKEYDFWGYTDIDMIYGDIRSFLNDNVLNEYEKIFQLGHFGLIKNTPEMNRLFFKKFDNQHLNYKQALENPFHMTFDEYPYGFSLIADKAGVHIWNKPVYGDIDLYKFSFRKLFAYDSFNKSDDASIIQYFAWENGRLFNYILKAENEVVKDEMLYVHFQKRSFEMQIISDTTSQIIFIPNRVLTNVQNDNDIFTMIDLSRNETYLKSKLEIDKKNASAKKRLQKIFNIWAWKRVMFKLIMEKVYCKKGFVFDKNI